MPSGFLYNIRAVVDKESFQQGVRELEKLEQTSVKLLKGIVGLGAAAIGSATIAGKVATEELKVARAVGVSTETLGNWKIAVNLAGASASGLIGTLSSLENKMQHLKLGQVDHGLARNLGLMGIGYGDFAKMNSEDRMSAVFNKADGMADKEMAATLVGDILGQAGKEYYESMKAAGKSFDEQVNEARKLNYMTEKNSREAAIFSSEMKSVKEAGKSIAMLFGSEIGAALTPAIRKVKNYLMENKAAIQKGIQGIAKTVGVVADAIGGTIAKISPYIDAIVSKFGGLDQLIVKIGIGFASMKLLKVAGGIKQIISSVNMLKTAMGGIGTALKGGILYLLLDEIMVHAQGGKTVIWDRLIPALKELSKYLGFDNVDWKSIANGFGDVVKAIGGFAGETIKVAIKLIGDLVELIKALLTGDMDKAGEKLKELFKHLKDGFESLFNTKEGGKKVEQNYEKTKKETGSTVKAIGAAIATSFEEAPVIGSLVKTGENMGTQLANSYQEAQKKKAEEDAKKAAEREQKLYENSDTFKRQEDIINQITTNAEYNANKIPIKDDYRFKSDKEFEAEFKHPKSYYNFDLLPEERIDDGIVAPGGHVTSVSPDDWVFAVKNVADLAGAFFPGLTTNNNEQSIIINQNFGIENARGNEAYAFIKQQAYRGTSEALSQTLRNGMRNMQMMSGTL